MPGDTQVNRQPSCHSLWRAVVTCTTQTQPGLPATSSLDAELQGVSRAARAGIFLKDLITLDFGQTCGQSALALEPNCEVCEFYLQGALQAKLLSSGEVKGTVNCANFLTSIPSRERRCDKHCLDLELECMKPPQGEDILSSSKHINVKVSQINKQQT